MDFLKVVDAKTARELTNKRLNEEYNSGLSRIMAKVADKAAGGCKSVIIYNYDAKIKEVLIREKGFSVYEGKPVGDNHFLKISW